jgi:hypothetical protein
MQSGNYKCQTAIIVRIAWDCMDMEMHVLSY